MRLKITQEFFLNVDPDLYMFIPDDGTTLESRIEKYEAKEINNGIVVWDNLETGETKVEVIKE